MEKRGQAEIWETLTLFEVLAGIAVATFLILAALGYNSVTTFGKTYLKNDLQMISSAVSSSPAIIQVNYPIDKGYKVSFEEEIRIESEPSLALGGYKNLTLDLDGTLRQSK